MSESKDVIDILESEDEVISAPLNNTELHDLKGNLITLEDARATLPENADLIKRAASGDKKAFETLYMQSYRYVFFVTRQYIPDDETTYDAIQETFLKVYKNISLLHSPDAYYGWLTTIAKNTAIDILRTTHFETRLSYEENDEALSEDKQTEKDVTVDVETVLKKLDPNDADLLSLVYYDGMRINAIAKMQGVPATTVYSRLNRAKRNLKAQLNAHGIDKAIYSGNFISMITVAIRNIIGTALLSFAIAQQILYSIIGKESKKELAIAKIIRAHQKKLALKIASCIVAISIIASSVTVLLLTDWGKVFRQKSNDNVTETVTEYHYYNETSSTARSDENSGGFWQNLFGGSSSNDDAGSDNSSNTSSDSFWNNLFGSGDKDNTSSTDSSSNTSQSGKGSWWWNKLFGSSDDSSSKNSSSDNSSNTSSSTSSDDNTHENESGADDDNTSSESSTPSSSSSSSSSSSNLSSGASSSSSGSSSSSSSSQSSSSSETTSSTVFVPDCDESQYNTLGNYYSNINVAQQGDWLYYVADTSGNELYKMKKDATQRQIIKSDLSINGSSNKHYLNVVGDWIYYIDIGSSSTTSDIYRIRTDGSFAETVYEAEAKSLQVLGNIAFYNTASGCYKLDLTTRKATYLGEGKIYLTEKYYIYSQDSIYIYNHQGDLLDTLTSRSITAVYNSAMILNGKYVYDFNNIGSEPKNAASGMDVISFRFYSPYNGGYIGAYAGGNNLSIDGYVFSVSDQTVLEWPFRWSSWELGVGGGYAAFDDGYLYFIMNSALWRQRPDGTDFGYQN